MIKLIESTEELLPCAESPFGCRIRSTAFAYGVGEPFARFWKQEDRAFMAKLDDILILETVGETDWEELAAFIRTLDVRTVSCLRDTAQKLGFSVAQRGEIMEGTPPADILPEPGAESDPSVREIYAFLCEATTENFRPPEFEPFYMDMSYRIRHSAGMSEGIRQDGKLVSCAVCPAVTENAAVISAVAVLPELRRRGLGKATLNALTARLNRSKLYIFRAEGENESFYRALGFCPCGNWAEIHL